MTEKPIFDETDITQADGEKDVPEELGNAEVLPMEPVEQKALRLQEENDRLKEQQLRLAAEFDNFKKRVARERTETADRAQAAFVVKMLSVLDDLDRLVAEEGGAQQGGPHYEATVLINKKLRKELETTGLESISPTGQPFDPKVHEAVSTLPPPDPSKDHIVAATFQTGYTFKGTLIRPAMVQVYSDPGQV